MKQLHHNPRILALSALLALSAFVRLPAQSDADTPLPFRGWKTANTAHFTFVYEDETRAFAETLARNADAHWDSVSKAYGKPQDNIKVVVTGRTSESTAYAEGLSHYIGISAVPPLDPLFGYRANWYDLYFLHELIHIANFTLGPEKPAARIFGPLFNFIDLASLPPWSIEGLTTVLETELTQGGRGRSPLFELQYKALALENSFIPYKDIGLEKEPPEGQIYVLGYLLMRSVADRFGIPALAEIERERRNGSTWDEALEKITGTDGETLYRDIKIALLKKYAQERSIPEGVIVSPRKTGTSYFKPAYADDKTIVSIRDEQGKPRAAVEYSIASRTETILFEGSFSDRYALAADSEGRRIASLVSYRFDRAPGYESRADLYTLGTDKKLYPLTQGRNLYQPALSLTGGRLVAVEQTGYSHRLVEVDGKTGKVRVLLESDTERYIQPALSNDGSQISFLAVVEGNAYIATAPMPRYEFAYPIPAVNIIRLAHSSGTQSDVFFPSWSPEGNLTWASNERGRLEIWESGTEGRRPVLQDPIGAYWALKTKEGILYASFSGSGYVLKMKPLAEWGKSVSFIGPSLPGSIVTLGEKITDYPGFPNLGNLSKNKDEKSERTENVIPAKEAIHTVRAIPLLQNEGAFYNAPELFAWLPTFEFAVREDKSLTTGFGAAALLTGLPLQNGAGFTAAAIHAQYYPTDNQLDAGISAIIPFRFFKTIFSIGRDYGQALWSPSMRESSYLALSGAVPLYGRSLNRDTTDIAFISGFEAQSVRESLERFSLDAGVDSRELFLVSAGIDAYQTREFSESINMKGNAVARFMVASFPGVFEGNVPAWDLFLQGSFGSRTLQGEITVSNRWFDFPIGSMRPGTVTAPSGWVSASDLPGLTLFRAAVLLPGSATVRLFTEKSFSYSTPPRIESDPYLYSGLECEVTTGRASLSAGIALRSDFSRSWRAQDDLRAFVSYRLDALHGKVP